MRRRFLLLSAALALGAPTLAQAATIGFTNASAFRSAVAGLPSCTVNFESIGADTLLSAARPQRVVRLPVSTRALTPRDWKTDAGRKRRER